MIALCICENCNFVGDESRWKNDESKQHWSVCPGCGDHGTNHDNGSRLNLETLLNNTDYEIVKKGSWVTKPGNSSVEFKRFYHCVRDSILLTLAQLQPLNRTQLLVNLIKTGMAKISESRVHAMEREIRLNIAMDIMHLGTSDILNLIPKRLVPSTDNNYHDFETEKVYKLAGGMLTLVIE